MANGFDESSDFCLLEFRNWRPPLVVQILLYPIILVGAIALGVLSIPGTFIWHQWVAFSERRLAERLRARGRGIQFSTALDLAINGKGTFIGEMRSGKGPYRLWWTQEDVVALSPFECCHAEFVWEEYKKADFFAWCANRYTDLSNGTGLIVLMSDSKELERNREQLDELRTRKRIVEIIGYRKPEHLKTDFGI